MGEIKTYIIMVIGALFTLLSPIQNFMWAMVLLFAINFAFGLVAAIVNKEGWSTKKALMFFAYCFIFFVTAASFFVIGKFMEEEAQAIAVVKILCYVAIYIFGTNICRNWLNILRPGMAWYKFVDLLYYVLSVKFIERFDIVKKWQEERKTHVPGASPSSATVPGASPSGKEAVPDASPLGHTILDKDDN